jgi:hypothetical protein
MAGSQRQNQRYRRDPTLLRELVGDTERWHGIELSGHAERRVRWGVQQDEEVVSLPQPVVYHGVVGKLHEDRDDPLRKHRRRCLHRL